MKFIHSVGADGPWTPGSRAFICMAHLQREKGSSRQRDCSDFQRPSQERERGLFPSSRPAKAATGRNANDCLPPCLCESRKYKRSNFRHQETNICGAYSRFQLPSGAPSSRFAHLEEQGLASGFLGTNQIPQRGTCRYGRWGPHFQIPLACGH